MDEALLMARSTAAGHSWLTEAELLALYVRATLPGALVGDRLLFRRGDLANLGKRLLAGQPAGRIRGRRHVVSRHRWFSVVSNQHAKKAPKRRAKVET